MEGNGQAKILVIDDDFDTTEMLKIILGAEHFDVITTNHSPEGIDLAYSERPDVIVLDLLMPEMDGWQVCEAVRKFSPVPILILSALSKPGMAVKALDAGADDYLLKPMASGILIAHIRKLLRRARLGKDEVNGMSLSTKEGA
jgi:two-component system response regulator ResD